MNNISIVGRLARDPSLKSVGDKECCELCVAVDKRFKRGEASFFDASSWGQKAAFVNQHFKKGDGIAITGRHEQRTWEDKEGKKRSAWRLEVEDISFPPGKAQRKEEEPKPDTDVPF